MKLVITRNGINNLPWLLSGGGVVKIHQRLPIQLSFKYWKVFPDSLRVKHRPSSHLSLFLCCAPTQERQFLQHTAQRSPQQKAFLQTSPKFRDSSCKKAFPHPSGLQKPHGLQPHHCCQSPAWE